MAFKSRLKADPEYFQALGWALYSFTYLEALVVQIIIKLSPTIYKDRVREVEDTVVKGRHPTAGVIAAALKDAIAEADNTAQSMTAPLRQRLIDFQASFDAAVKNYRNQVLHARPYTTPEGYQELIKQRRKWPIEEVEEAATLFQKLASEGSKIYDGPLAAERP